MMRWLVALVLLFPSIAKAECTLGKLAEIPITMRGPRPETLAKINGREVRFLVDSGAFYSVISPGTVAENNLRQRAAPQGLRVSGIGGSVDVGMTTVKTFTLAGFDLPNIDFIVGGSETGSAGVVGQNVLHLADVEYDLPHGRISLFQPKGCGSKILAYWAGSQPFSELSLEQADQRLARAMATIRINGQSVRAIFDTGAGSTVLSLATARRLGIKFDGPGVVSAGFGRGFGSKMVKSWIVPIDVIEIGGETLHRSHLHVEDLGPDTEMLIGADFFLAHRVYVANSQRKMWFTYAGGGFFDANHEHSRAVDAEGKAIELKDDAVPTDAEGLSQHGMALLAKGDVPGALADLDRAVALAPTEARYLTLHAMVQMRGGHPALAEADLDKALAIKPDDGEALIQRARLRLAAHEPARAVADLDRASMLLDKASDSRFDLGGLYLSFDQPVKAIPEFDRWIDLHPDDSRRPIALSNRCAARGLLGQDMPRALADCNAALKGTPRKDRALENRGLVELRMGNVAVAVKDYDAALAIDPKLAWALYGRGLAKAKLGQAAEAEKDIADARAIAPRIAERAARWGVVP